MNPNAVELNTILEKEHPHVYDMLSDLGKHMFFPKGILTQTAEAKEKAHRLNATIGIAKEQDAPMYLGVMQDQLDQLAPEDVYPYAPPAGKKELREAWKDKLVEDNRSLTSDHISLPIATNAITHGLSIVADLFCDAGDTVITPDKLWGNYRLTFGTRRGASFSHYKFFNEEDTFNVAGFSEALDQAQGDKLIVILNFPNNPTGYTPHEEEVKGIIQSLKAKAEAGQKIVVVADDAYFGLFYEDSLTESVFAQLINIHPHILPIKLDGATKEEFAWGLRVGFITFPFLSEGTNLALEKKVNGIIRGTISSGPHPSQSMVLQALKNPEFRAQQREKENILKRRALKVKEVLSDAKYDHAWNVYPFNSGYFMCLELLKVNAETLRTYLLDEYGVGTIAINDTDLRIAFSCVEEEDLPEMFDIIYQAATELEK
ncbi:aminotransferase class I/II-fold pyridoxal phosphate-dependent enzyme [Caldalkalibacillus salinus]|uniref:aminotransferase class I/II-fold pyridoxal phosphate-dependent enzyme n=1 Tax=Caldalkalibacillus salinus TaxID=2803787 RepID=UPI001921BB3C|nr:aminotransferase class I/II-fold pyridoxal phosphate-dependent enzyme [Caldalkalibacillus salinus]